MAEFIGNEFTYLLPGELIVSVEPLKISTVLGSCVAVCMYDRDRNVAGMNHYMLPFNKSNDPNQFKFGDTSLSYMLSQMMKLGAQKNKIISRVYGGGSMFTNTGPSFNIGKQNIDIALKFLKENEIIINAIETGGKTGRKVIFDTSAGVISSYLLNEMKR
ncbi:MAG: chemotaxis protein CheD [Bacteroidales bacterium]|nr:chemotaxis protein CheD [Bacteroidales bacterium]